MLSTEQDESAFRVHYRSYRMALALLLLPPLMLIEFVPRWYHHGLDNSEFAALALGVLLPLSAAVLLVEFASFRFSLSENQFSWRWRKPFQQKSLDLPLHRVVHVKREVVETTDTEGEKFSFRLVVELDDGELIGLTQGYSRIHARKLKQVVDDIREYLGHVVPMR